MLDRLRVDSISALFDENPRPLRAAEKSKSRVQNDSCRKARNYLRSEALNFAKRAGLPFPCIKHLRPTIMGLRSEISKASVDNFSRRAKRAFPRLSGVKPAATMVSRLIWTCMMNAYSLWRSLSVRQFARKPMEE